MTIIIDRKKRTRLYPDAGGVLFEGAIAVLYPDILSSLVLI